MATDQPAPSEPTWSQDPTGRHQLRWFDGSGWTDQVADGEEVSTDPLDPADATLASSPPSDRPGKPAPEARLDDSARLVGPASDPDRYRLIQAVASGGEGTLWRASITVDSVELPVAIKALHARNIEMLDEWRKRWQAQSELLRSLDHPNVVRVREVFEGADPHPPSTADPHGHSLYLVMSWVEGESLAEWVASRPSRDPRDVALIVSKLAGAVDYLHAGPLSGHAVLHRDIKPANVIIAGSDVTLVDFGLVRVLSGSPLTQATGSPQYWAPEVALGEEYSEAADRYSLGATAYYLFTGTAPTPGDRAAMRAALEAVPGIVDPAAFADHVLAMVSINPAERPASSSAWARDLVVGSLSGRYSPEGPTVPRVASAPTVGAVGAEVGGSSGRRRKARWLIPAAVVLLAGVAGASVMVSASGSDEKVQAATDREATTSTVAVADARVPSVVGSDLDAARAELTELGFDVTIAYQSSSKPPGTVLSQTPAPGKSGATKVELVVAEAPTELPDVVGQRLAAATATLEGLGVTVTTVDALNEEVADGTVLEQDPPAGSAFSGAVTLKVARRPVVTFLADLGAVEGGLDAGAGSVSGTTYTRSVLRPTEDSVGYPVKVGFDLARGYRILRATVGLSDDSKSDSIARVEVYADGRPLFSQDLALGQAVPIDLDVTGVLRLELLVTKLAPQSYDSALVVWGDAQVLGAQGEVPAQP